jgi:RNA polymerase sigma-70 factor (ECF subfamily)
VSAVYSVNGAQRAGASATAAERTRELYENYGQRVFTFCNSRLRNREEAQDATQTTFIYAMRALERGIVLEFELAWLLKIAFNVCRSTRRSTHWKMATTNQGLAEIEELPDPSPADEVERNARLEALRDGLHSLPENQQRAILLREWQGLSYAEIADELGLTVGAVETLLFRARRNLTRHLQPARGGFTALDLGAIWPLLYSFSRGLVAKALLVGAAASIALVPLSGEHLVQARAADTPPAKVETGRKLGTAPSGGQAAAVAKLSAARPNDSRPERRAPRNPHPSLRQRRETITGSARTSPQPRPGGGAVISPAPSTVSRSSADPPAPVLPPSVVDPPAVVTEVPAVRLPPPSSLLPAAEEALAPVTSALP